MTNSFGNTPKPAAAAPLYVMTQNGDRAGIDKLRDLNVTHLRITADDTAWGFITGNELHLHYDDDKGAYYFDDTHYTQYLNRLPQDALSKLQIV